MLLLRDWYCCIKSTFLSCNVRNIWFEIILTECKITMYRIVDVRKLNILIYLGSVSWGCRIRRLHLCRGWKPALVPKDCPVYDIKLFDGAFPALELWGIWSTSSLQLLQSSLYPRVWAPDRIQSMCQIQLFDHLNSVQIIDLC